MESDLDELINSCHRIHETINTADTALSSICSTLLKYQNQINVTYNGQTTDFMILLDELHSSAMQYIKETGHNNFSSLLLDVLNTGTVGTCTKKFEDEPTAQIV